MNNPTVSLPVVNNNTSTNDPTDHEDQPPPRKQSKFDTSSTDPRDRGRGFTGGPRGRPLGAKNKPKVPEDDQPKLPKKKGRPLGAKNKAPRRPRTPKPPAPTGERSPVDDGSPQPPFPGAGAPFALDPAIFPPAVREYEIPDAYIPDGYAPADSTLPARHPRPEDVMTPMFSDPSAAPSPYINPRLFEDDEQGLDFANLLLRSMSPEGNNDIPIDPALLDNGYFSNDPAILAIDKNNNNNNNNNNSSSSSDNDAESSGALQSHSSQEWGPALSQLNWTEENNPFFP